MPSYRLTASGASLNYTMLTHADDMQLPWPWNQLYGELKRLARKHQHQQLDGPE